MKPFAICPRAEVKGSWLKEYEFEDSFLDVRQNGFTVCRHYLKVKDGDWFVEKQCSSKRNYC